MDLRLICQLTEIKRNRWNESLLNNNFNYWDGVCAIQMGASYLGNKVDYGNMQLLHKKFIDDFGKPRIQLKTLIHNWISKNESQLALLNKALIEFNAEQPEVSDFPTDRLGITVFDI